MAATHAETISSCGRAAASALFRPHEEFMVNYRRDGKPIQLTFRTRYLDRGYSVRVPGDLWLDAEGEADDLSEAGSNFTNAGRDIAAVIALGANAAIKPIEPELILETGRGLTEREYFQRSVPPEEVRLTSRFIDVGATTALLEAHARNPERDRLTRAISQYTQALYNWRLGEELLAMAHLFMGRSN